MILKFFVIIMALLIPLYWISPQLVNIMGGYMLGTMIFKYILIGISALLERSRK